MIELAALVARGPQPRTLSENVWHWEGLKDHLAKFRTLRLSIAAFFLAWVTVHFLTGRTFFLW